MTTLKEYQQWLREHEDSDCTCRCQRRVTERFPDDDTRKGERYMLLCPCCDSEDCPVHYPEPKSS